MVFQVIFFILYSLTHAQTVQLPSETQRTSNEKKQIRAVRVNSDGFELDGKLKDEMWQEAEFVSDFLQREPNEGTLPHEKTEVGFLYDDNALYVGARMHSYNSDEIRALVTRRDKETSSEQLVVSLDTYHDRRTAYSFGITAAGIRIDYYHPKDDADPHERDYRFDPVWEAKTDINSDGWTVEMRIPFSQLLFNKRDPQVWGVNINRRIPSRNEDNFWVLIPQQETGWASRFGNLVGIKGIKPSRHLELLPYAAGNATLTSDVNPNNPFHRTRDFDLHGGTDLKMGLGPNITLFATVNPDFGQVEADPAKVNLSQFETFFPDRRPFFTDGFQFLGGTRLWAETRSTFFYPRRIGAPPRGRAEGTYVKIPDSTTILGATKVVGRMRSGLSIGALTALTAREYAKTFDQFTNTFGTTEVEPMTSFNVLRMKQELDTLSSTVGLMLTGTRRDFSANDPLANHLIQQAYTGGGDWDVRFGNGKYEFAGELGFSFIEGNSSAIEKVQRSSPHYFQRPDATHVTLDPYRTSLFGYTTSLDLKKKGGRHWLWEVGAVAESPGFAPNDLSLQFTSDDIDVWAELGYRETTPTTLFHKYEVSSWIYNSWNYGGVRQRTTSEARVDLIWQNFMRTYFELRAWTRAKSDLRTRGGPLMGTGAGMRISIKSSSSDALKNTWSTLLSYSVNEEGGWDYTIQGGMAFRPNDRWEFSSTPRYSRSIDAQQYIKELEGGSDATFGRRYIFSFVNRSTLAVQLRLNYALTPDLSIEVYAEPFASSGHFYDFGELAEAGSQELRTYDTDETTVVQKPNGLLTVTDNTGSFNLSNHDFNIRSFRSTFVLRWEWRLGSTLFLVWQQDRSSYETQGNPVGTNELWEALTVGGDNFIAIKVNNWLPVN